MTNERTRRPRRILRSLSVVLAVAGLLTLALGSAMAHGKSAAAPGAVIRTLHRSGPAFVPNFISKAAPEEDSVDETVDEGDDTQGVDEGDQGENEDDQGSVDEGDQGENEDAQGDENDQGDQADQNDDNDQAENDDGDHAGDSGDDSSDESDGDESDGGDGGGDD
jgi:hypothetical protein